LVPLLSRKLGEGFRDHTGVVLQEGVPVAFQLFDYLPTTSKGL
jgi:hypothetical protein